MGYDVMGRKNLWMKDVLEQIFDAYVGRFKGSTAEVLPSEVVAAGIIMFFDLDEEARLKAIERARNFDLEQFRKVGTAADAVNHHQSAAASAAKAQPDTRRKAKG